MDSEPAACATWKHTGIRTWQDLKGRETTFGASGPSSGSSIFPKAMGAILGVKVKVIHGYQGTQSSNLAMQRGELDGTCGLYMSTIRSQFLRYIESGDLRPWLTFGNARPKEFPDLPTIHELAGNDDDRNLAKLIFTQDAIGRPISGPPGLSAAVLAALRQGLMATMVDTAFLAEARKIGLGIDPMSGEETHRQFQNFYALPAATVERARRIIAAR
jgi:tripartite-type tricarboxylate transporter receptor subunit TctC